MDYEKAWESLKAWLDEALDEGRERGFDKLIENDNKKEHGMYEAYDNVRHEMMYAELNEK